MNIIFRYSWEKKRREVMFNKRRSELQIIERILDLSQTGAKKTELLYQSNMSFAQLETYLINLIDKDIIEENIVPGNNGNYNKVYINTEKGNSLLSQINKISKMILLRYLI